MNSVDAVDDPLERVRAGIRAFLRFFAEHPEFVELLIQERAQFKDRTTAHVHRAPSRECRALAIALPRADRRGRVRDMPVDRITDIIGNLLYGTIFTNYFSGQSKSVEVQAHDILDVVFNGILTAPERESRGQAMNLRDNIKRSARTRHEPDDVTVAGRAKW